jgi:hypothetical protein
MTSKSSRWSPQNEKEAAEDKNLLEQTVVARISSWELVPLKEEHHERWMHLVVVL